MGSDINPWVVRFESLLDVETLKKRATVLVPPLVGLTSMPIELAAKRLEDALKTTFYPTTQCLAVLRRLVGVAHAHCVTTYSDSKTFLGGVYAKHAPLPDFSMPICLTGLAGTGKTEILNAFSRIQQADSEVVIDAQHSPFPLRKSWSVTIQARSSPKDVVRILAQAEGTPSELIEKCRKRAFRDGAPTLTADEFQFATGSEQANARVTQMLLSLGYIGIPFAYAANFSLVRRLQRRPEEEQQRLLSHPVVLLPDPWSSDDWQKTLQAQREVAPDILSFDPIADARSLHAYSAGRKRAMAKLIVLAFRARQSPDSKIDLEAIRRAYHSTEFAGDREEAEILATQAIQNRANSKRKDLWCPIPLPADAAAAFLDSLVQARGEQVAEAELKAALTGAERRKVAEIEGSLKTRKRAPGEVVPLRQKTAPTADELKHNANWYRDQV